MSQSSPVGLKAEWFDIFIFIWRALNKPERKLNINLPNTLLFWLKIFVNQIGSEVVAWYDLWKWRVTPANNQYKCGGRTRWVFVRFELNKWNAHDCDWNDSEQRARSASIDCWCFASFQGSLTLKSYAARTISCEKKFGHFAMNMIDWVNYWDREIVTAAVAVAMLERATPMPRKKLALMMMPTITTTTTMMIITDVAAVTQMKYTCTLNIANISINSYLRCLFRLFSLFVIPSGR